MSQASLRKLLDSGDFPKKRADFDAIVAGDSDTSKRQMLEMWQALQTRVDEGGEDAELAAEALRIVRGADPKNVTKGFAALADALYATPQAAKTGKGGAVVSDTNQKVESGNLPERAGDEDLLEDPPALSDDELLTQNDMGPGYKWQYEGQREDTLKDLRAAAAKTKAAATSKKTRGAAGKQKPNPPQKPAQKPAAEKPAAEKPADPVSAAVADMEGLGDSAPQQPAAWENKRAYDPFDINDVFAPRSAEQRARVAAIAPEQWREFMGQPAMPASMPATMHPDPFGVPQQPFGYRSPGAIQRAESITPEQWQSFMNNEPPPPPDAPPPPDEPPPPDAPPPFGYRSPEAIQRAEAITPEQWQSFMNNEPVQPATEQANPFDYQPPPFGYRTARQIADAEAITPAQWQSFMGESPDPFAKTGGGGGSGQGKAVDGSAEPGERPRHAFKSRAPQFLRRMGADVITGSGERIADYLLPLAVLGGVGAAGYAMLPGTPQPSPEQASEREERRRMARQRAEEAAQSIYMPPPGQ